MPEITHEKTNQVWESKFNILVCSSHDWFHIKNSETIVKIFIIFIDVNHSIQPLENQVNWKLGKLGKKEETNNKLKIKTKGD